MLVKQSSVYLCDSFLYPANVNDSCLEVNDKICGDNELCSSMKGRGLFQVKYLCYFGA